MHSLARMSLRALAGAIICCAAVARAGEPSPTGNGQSSQSPGGSMRTLIKQFTFLEPHHEPVPMDWERHREAGFPHYAQAAFDSEMGCPDVPGFRFSLLGGSIGYVYRSDGVPVSRNCDYLITAWVRTEQIENARAGISACYLNRDLEVIPGSQQFSDWVGGAGQNGEWNVVQLELPNQYPQARYVGLGTWLVQRKVWSQQPDLPHTVYRQDIYGAAWFDQVTVYRMPRALLATANPSNLFEADEQCALQVSIGDGAEAGLAATVTLLDDAGQTIAEYSTERDELHVGRPATITLPSLEPGIYRAVLSMWTGGAPLTMRQVQFAKLGPRLTESASDSGFGVSLRHDFHLAPEALADCLLRLNVSHIKLPLWQGEQQAAGIELDTPGSVELLNRLAAASVQIVGVLGELPTELRPGHDPSHFTVIDLLLTDPKLWRAPLVAGLASCVDYIGVWQLGQDDHEAILWDERRGQAIGRLRDELGRLMAKPSLAATASVELPWTWTEPPAEHHSLRVPNRILPTAIPEYIHGATEDDNGSRQWLVIEPLEAGRYREDLRRADLAKRLIMAKAAGHEAVFLPQPWVLHGPPDHPDLWPTADLLILRTVAGALAGTRPVGPLYLGPGVHCWWFDRGDGRAALALWAEDAGADGKELRRFLGERPRRIETDGRVRDLPTVDGEHVLRLGQEPVLVDGVEGLVASVLASFRVFPEVVPASLQVHQMTLEFENLTSEPLAGTILLDGPREWEIRPQRFGFSLQPGENLRQEFGLKLGYGEVAGGKVLTALFEVEGKRAGQVRAQAPFRLGLQDVEVDVLAQVDSGQLIVRQMVTNRAAEPLSFTGYLLAAGFPRQERVIAQLPPNQTVVKEYVLESAEALIGVPVRVGLKEIGGTRWLNQVIYPR